jgi:hypothetical protein
MTEKSWKHKLENLLINTPAKEISAGDVYDYLGLAREKQHRSALESITVRSLMNELGWAYQARDFHPRFVLKQSQAILSVGGKPVDYATMADEALRGLNDRHLLALKIIEEQWMAHGSDGISAHFLAEQLELTGSDPERVARHILDNLTKRKLVDKKILVTTTGNVARYFSTGSTVGKIAETDIEQLKGRAVAVLGNHCRQTLSKRAMAAILHDSLGLAIPKAELLVDKLLRTNQDMFKLKARAIGQELNYIILPPEDCFVPDPNLPAELSNGYIYFVQWSNDLDHVKIGYSTRPANRIMNFLTVSPHNILVLAIIGTSCCESESYLHSAFHAYRRNGEWFQYAGRLKEYIESLPTHVLSSLAPSIASKSKTRILLPSIKELDRARVVS